MIRSFAVLLAVAMAAGATVDAAAQERARNGWQSELLGQWLDAVERHSPGEIDSPLIGAARWSSTDLRKLWADVQVLLDIIANPKHNRFTVAPLEYERRGQRGEPPTVTFRASERAILDALADRVRAAGLNAVLRRAAVLHTDVVTLAPGLEQPPGSTPADAPIRLLVGDGTSAGTRDVSLQWELARMILSNGSAEPAFDAFVRDWYRATVALAHSVQSFDSIQLREGLRLFPNDPVLLLLAGCEREAFATPLFQVFAQSFRNAQMRPDIASEDAELDAAAGFFRRALAADEGLGEARVHLGRVLGLKQRYADSARELRRALDGRLDPALQHYAELFLGAALEGLGEAAAARDAFRRAADGTPGARAAHLAVARIAREMGDREETTARLEQAMSLPGTSSPSDPWWVYRAAQGRQSAGWLEDVRRAAKEAAR